MNVRTGLDAKHRRLSEQLKHRLVVENLSPGDRFLSVRAIAREYAVSVVTAHRSVQELVADDLLTVRQFQGCFVGSAVSSLLKTSTKPLITVFTAESLFSFVDDVLPESFIRGIRESVPLARVRMEYIPVDAPIQFLESFVAANPVKPALNAYVLRSVDANVKRFFAGRNLPAVVTGNLDPGIDLPTVQRDERQIAYNVTRFLLAKGYTRIAYIEWDAPLAGHEKRREGFVTALREAGVINDSSQADASIVQVPISEARLVNALRQLLDGPNRPQAVIFGQERHTAWGLRTAHDLRISIPRDLAIVALGGGVLTDHLVPRVTAVPRKNYESGAAVGAFLSKLLKGDPIADRVHRISATLVEHETT